MELPPVLTTMFNHLLTTYGSVKSWNLYESDSGTININVRFSNTPIDGDHVSHVESMSYKRLSRQQAERNKNRAAMFRIKQQTNADTHKMHNNSKSDSKKRKVDTNSPEMSRNDTEDSFSLQKYDVDTPIKVSDINVDPQVSPQNAHDESFSSCTSESQMPKEYDFPEEYNSSDNNHQPDKYNDPPRALFTEPSTSKTDLFVSSFSCPSCALKMTATQFVHHKCLITKSEISEPPDKKDNCA